MFYEKVRYFDRLHMTKCSQMLSMTYYTCWRWFILGTIYSRHSIIYASIAITKDIVSLQYLEVTVV